MKNLFIVLMIVPLIPQTNAFGQKEGESDAPIGIFQSRAEYNAFMGGAKRAAYGEGGNAQLQAMIPMLNDIALNRPVGSTAKEYQTQGSTMGLLSNEVIRSEIEMVDDQYQELKDKSAEIQSRAAEQFRSLDFGNREELVKQITKIREGAENDLDAILLPHQLERLRQIRMQTLLQRRSLVDVLTSNPIKSELEITDGQTAELKEFEKEVQADLRKEIGELQKKAHNRLISKLKPDQRQEFNKMVGDRFEFPQRAGPSQNKNSGKGKRKGKN